MLEVVFLYNKSNPYGISEDVKLFELTLQSASASGGLALRKARHSDPLEPPVLCDLAFHFEIPVYGYFGWARRNILIVNPEWWENGWDAYLDKTAALIFKCSADRDRFIAERSVPSSCQTFVLPWTTPITPASFQRLPASTDPETGFLWLLGASKHKRAAAEKVLSLWDLAWPALHVYTTTPLAVEAVSNVHLNIQDLDESQRRQKQRYFPGHLIFSQAEALGLAAQEGQAAGAFLLGNALPTYVEAFPNEEQVILLPATLEPLKASVKDTFATLTKESLTAAIEKFRATNLTECRQVQQEEMKMRQAEFKVCVEQMCKKILATPLHYKIRTLPPVCSDLPKISIITLLHNRRKFVELAFHNLILCDYPKDKIEWVVVEDSDKVEEQASDKIMKFARQAAPIDVTYIPLEKVVSIGEKRNIGCKRASADIILMMDDDDHYPPSSFRRRVGWLLGHPSLPEAVACTTIACYDLLKGTSAVNTPPWGLGLGQRISEATLTFKKTWWEARPFPTINMAEGEGFVEGREADVLELPPQQMIVAMSHGLNSSSRRIPPGPSGKPSCFWGFPPEFLKFLHGLAGITVEEEKEPKSKK
jgi:hypothetical protein